MDIPGSFTSPNSSFNMSMELRTPIKKLDRLNLHSPTSNCSIYPMIEDIFDTNVTNSMLNKGYSQKLTNNVLQELNLRASTINNSNINNMNSLGKPTSPNPINRRNSRYSQIHKKQFQNMTSIQNHYSVKEWNTTRSSQESKDLSSSDIKRRRTLTSDDMLSYKPIQSEQLHSSPIRKISPSKKHLNLHQLLNEHDTNCTQEFKVPSNRIRYSSLEMAGVKTAEHVSKLPRKPSSSNLQMKPSLNQISNPNLNKKSSIPTLNKKSSIPSLQKKSSIPSLQKQTSIPSLQKKSSFSNLPSTSSTLDNSNIRSSPVSNTVCSNYQTSPISSSKMIQKSLDSKISTYKPNLSISKSSYSISNRNSISPSRSSTTTNEDMRSKSISPSKSSHSISVTNSGYAKPSQLSNQDRIDSSPNKLYQKSSPIKSYQNSSPNKLYQNLSPSKLYQNSSLNKPEQSLSSSKSLNQNLNRAHSSLSHSRISPSKSYHSLTTPAKPTNHSSSTNSLYTKPTISSSQKSLNKFQRFKSRFD